MRPYSAYTKHWCDFFFFFSSVRVECIGIFEILIWFFFPLVIFYFIFSRLEWETRAWLLKNSIELGEEYMYVVQRVDNKGVATVEWHDLNKNGEKKERPAKVDMIIRQHFPFFSSLKLLYTLQLLFSPTLSFLSSSSVHELVENLLFIFILFYFLHSFIFISKIPRGNVWKFCLFFVGC